MCPKTFRARHFSFFLLCQKDQAGNSGVSLMGARVTQRLASMGARETQRLASMGARRVLI
ncbi:hypothetical protein [Leptospira interrogans]|uniref:Uncharacterized protein n=1 Tax=Leptospira interrogans str. UI 12758 TaxID=1049938 RepID=A0A0E2DDV0_LEPIR|nr:hypothetical protein [Leptospira interrogans]EKR53833.1 hypothetical protein LEP1GSC105_0380 [Leptospira interrogans str. UI 12758]